MNDVRSRISTSNISETGTGRLRYIQLQDSITFDATIQINIDGLGAQTISASTMLKSGSLGSEGFGSKTQFLNGGLSAGGDDVIRLELDLSYRSSLAVTITNADGFFIVWDEEVF